MKAFLFLFQYQTGQLKQFKFLDIFFCAGLSHYLKVSNTTVHSAQEQKVFTQHFPLSACGTIHGTQMPLGGISEFQQNSVLTHTFIHTCYLFHGQKK
jgi:hypothetical protein